MRTSSRIAHGTTIFLILNMRSVTKKIHARQISRTLLKAAPSLVMPFYERSKSRLLAKLSNGEEVAISLQRGSVMRAGDVLVADDGGLIMVVAENEHVLRVTANNPHDLLRAAYHLGNRHVPVEVGPTHLLLEDDPVLSDMLRLIGVKVEKASLPFEPEHGAYGGGHKHGHDASFKEDYSLAQSAYHAHDHTHLHDHGHVHSQSHVHNHVSKTILQDSASPKKESTGNGET